RLVVEHVLKVTHHREDAAVQADMIEEAETAVGTIEHSLQLEALREAVGIRPIPPTLERSAIGESTLHPVEDEAVLVGKPGIAPRVSPDIGGRLVVRVASHRHTGSCPASIIATSGRRAA